MAHFAKVENGIVTNVIVAEQSFIDTGLLGDPKQWIQTSYNTSGGIHKLGGEPLRKNYAGIGYLYIKEIDAFVPPKPFPSWVLDEKNGTWKAPVDRPEGNFIWQESTLSWIEGPNVLPNLNGDS